MDEVEKQEIVLDVQDVSLRSRQREILSHVDLKISSGEVVTIIGPNGAGKTTLIRTALGLLKPTSGKVWMRPGLSVGYLPQRFHVDPVLPLTVRRFLQLSGAVDDAQMVVALTEVGAEKLLTAAMQTLSGGETQRVLLARTLLRNPELLVLDEPAQGVDLHGQVELFSLLEKVRRERGCSVLMISHDLHLVMASTDRVICLNRHVCCTGTPAAVTRNPAFVELFGEKAAANLAVYAHDREHQH
jgi:zinc transport system ATP-binding protein